MGINNFQFLLAFFFLMLVSDVAILDAHASTINAVALFDLFAVIGNFIDDFWGVMTVVWEMDAIKSVFEEYKQYNRNWHNNFVLPQQNILDEFKTKIHNLDTVKKYCSEINTVSMIKANEPWEKLGDYCDIPDGLTSSMAQQIMDES